ncbi:MAG TPA: ABC transporter permease [Actinomycetota bacterium]|nr:ABC transporter permease [Actinomycetota bacterium]
MAIADADAVAPPPASRRSIVWSRRRRAFAAHWRTFRRNRQGMVGLGVLSFFVLVAIVGPSIVDPAAIEEATAPWPLKVAPAADYPLGTDRYGRSVLDLMIVGSRISLVVGFTAALGAIVLGASVGITAGYFGGSRIDSILNGLTNWFLVIPWIALAIALAVVLGATLFNVIVVIAVTSWASTARVVRSQALSVKERLYVERARALGAGNWHLMSRHVLPNVFPVLFANTVLMVALAILSETTLSILGLGPTNAISWGRIIDESFSAGAFSAGLWWWLVPPGIAIMLVTLSFTMIGFALDEVLNPRLRDR